MPKRRIPAAEGEAAIAQFRRNPDDALGNEDAVALACRFALQELAVAAPGGSVEVRVPPYGAVQVIGGPSHTRGTPPAVIEMSPRVWLELVTGMVSWQDAVAQGRVDSSGHRANLQQWLPLEKLG